MINILQNSIYALQLTTSTWEMIFHSNPRVRPIKYRAALGIEIVPVYRVNPV